jgi:hypothetical protein
MSRCISFLHAGGIGDIVYAVPAILSVLKNKNADKAELYLEVGWPAKYPAGWHPLGNTLLDQDFVDRLTPLLKSQSYIHDVKLYDGRKVDCDLNGFRRLPINMNGYCLPRWYFLFIIGTNWDLSRPWIVVEANRKFKDYILVSRNPRLQSQYISYGFMNDLADKIVFVGVRHEFDEFRRECPNCKNFYEAPDFLELAQVLAGARFFCGNQGFIYTLAEAMKTPRLLETNNRAPNNIPTGPHCYEALFSQGFIYWFNFMCKEYPVRE